MRGTIIHNRGGKFPSGSLAIAFNSADDANFCILAYNKFDLRGPLYFRKGAMLIHSRGGGESVPVMQSFIFTHKKIDLEIASNRTILQGALALPDDTIWLKKNDLDAFMGSEAMREYFQGKPSEYAPQEYFKLNEAAIRDLDVGDRDELYRMLLQMKAYAATPQVFTFPNSSTDRSWRCVTALCEEEALWQEGGFSQEEQAE